jgi:hypothetical protein
MSDTQRSRRSLVFFLIGAALLSLLATAAAYRVGFAAMAAHADQNPERLRDFTFPIWQSHSLREHGFLTFLTADGFARKAAYANHATVYLWFMDLLFHVQRVVHAATMRVSAACLAMLATVLAIGFVVHERIGARLSFAKLVVLALGFVYAATLPTYWIALGRFNVDNGFIFVMPVLVMVSHYTARGEWGRRAFWFWALLLTLIMPMASALFACGMFARQVLRARFDDAGRFAAPVLLAFVSVLVYLEPVLVAKWLGFASENSTWAFRAGLDGDTTYFSNAFNSVLAPYYRRPAYLVVVPALIVFCQWLARPRRVDPILAHATDAHWWFVAHLFSFYALTLLFWPQAVSIHPYLYDAVLVGPIVTWGLVNFAAAPISARGAAFTSFCLALLIMFNLTSIAQAARCTQCAYPHWGLSGEHIG